MDLLTLALSGLIGLTALVLAAHFVLKAWQGWIDYKKLELASGCTPRAAEEEPLGAPIGGRIEIADLKERVRKLEAIASGIDL
jgi:hypothetical protein